MGSTPTAETNITLIGGTVYTLVLETSACNGLEGSTPLSGTNIGWLSREILGNGNCLENSRPLRGVCGFESYAIRQHGWVTERLNVLAWKVSVPHGTEGSNPSPSANMLLRAA